MNRKGAKIALLPNGMSWTYAGVNNLSEEAFNLISGQCRIQAFSEH